jgi:D-arabinose 1-dehydrogenase-like Zn-dependent alcohol dehydrogenase
MGGLGGMGSLGGMGAMSVSAANAMSAHHAAVTLANTADAEASALALLSVPAGSVQSPGFAPTAGADIAVVDVSRRDRRAARPPCVARARLPLCARPVPRGAALARLCACA